MLCSVIDLVNISHSFLKNVERCQFQLVLRTRRLANVGGQSDIHKINTILGHAIHSSIEQFIDSWVANPSFLPVVDQLVQDAKGMVNTIWDNAPTRIFEIINNIPLDEERNYRREQLNKISGQIQQFCRIWHEQGFQNFAHVSHEQYMAHQFNPKFDLCGSIDLVLSDQNGIHYVLDWKTGSSPSIRLGRSQLGIYAFLAHKEFSVPYSDIRCAFVSLRDGSCQIRSFNDKELKILEKRLEIINTVLAYIDKIQDEQWVVPNEQNCLNCNYREVCTYSI